MGNPVLRSNATFNQSGGAVVNGEPAYGQTGTPDDIAAMYGGPTATSVDMDRLTYDDVIVKSGGLIAVVLLAAALGWTMSSPPLTIGAAILGLVLGLVNAFKREPNPALIIAYGVAEGIFLGGISAMLDSMFPGVAVQALIATAVTFGVVLVGFRSGKLRATKKMTRIFMIAMLSYLAFSLVNLGVMIFGSSDSAFGLRSDVEIAGIPLGVIVGALAVLLASYSLVLDFESIQSGVQNGIARRYAWTAAFGLVVTLVWLYIEFLRIFAILAGRE